MTTTPEGEQPKTETEAPAQLQFPIRILVTGGSGFVGRHVVRELVARGHRPICLVRDRARFFDEIRPLNEEHADAVGGGVFEADALATAAQASEAAIHLIGIIMESRARGQTFERIHVDGTRAVLEACKAAKIRRYVHMSALGTRLNAISRYHQTKWQAECLVRDSGLDYTIFRPSVIHGPDGEFMRMLKQFVTSLAMPPVIPYFGDGMNRLQPVSVRDVAHCFVAALSNPATVGKVYELGGPEAMSWKELYRIARELIPGSRCCKPVVGTPVGLAKLLAVTVMKTPLVPKLLRFNTAQVQMSQEDSVCDITPVERTFGITLRDFRTELCEYAPRIP